MLRVSDRKCDVGEMFEKRCIEMWSDIARFNTRIPIVYFQFSRFRSWQVLLDSSCNVHSHLLVRRDINRWELSNKTFSGRIIHWNPFDHKTQTRWILWGPRRSSDKIIELSLSKDFHCRLFAHKNKFSKTFKSFGEISSLDPNRGRNVRFFTFWLNVLMSMAACDFLSVYLCSLIHRDKINSFSIAFV